MSKYFFCLLLFSFVSVFAQEKTGTSSNVSTEDEEYLAPPKETFNKWSLNLTFSDNGFGGGATLFHSINKDLQLFGGIMFSTAKDDREFETTDIYGNSYTPGKINRIFMAPVNLGIRYRLFRNDVSDELRPFIDGGISPTLLVYTPYKESLIPSFGYAKAKFTVGGFLGAGVDYLTSQSSSLTMNVRYYYLNTFGKGIESIQGKEKTFFGGLYFIFSYNFMK